MKTESLVGIGSSQYCGQQSSGRKIKTSRTTFLSKRVERSVFLWDTIRTTHMTLRFFFEFVGVYNGTFFDRINLWKK